MKSRVPAPVRTRRRNQPISGREKRAHGASGFGLEDDDRLVGARHDRLGDGDQVLLLAENAQARGLALAGVELCGGALRRMDAAGLDLRELYVEFRAVANAPLQDGQDCDAWQVEQQLLERDDVTRQIALSSGALEFS